MCTYSIQIHTHTYSLKLEENEPNTYVYTTYIRYYIFTRQQSIFRCKSIIKKHVFIVVLYSSDLCSCSIK